MIAVYFRVSTSQQNIGSQKHAVDKFLDGQDYTAYVDEGVSGVSVEGRQAYSRLLADLASGLISSVVVYSVDRFGRDEREVLRQVKWFDELGVWFISVTQPLINDPENPQRRFLLPMYAGMAAEEIKVVKQRLQNGKAKDTKEVEGLSDVAALHRKGHTKRYICEKTNLSYSQVSKIVSGL